MGLFCPGSELGWRQPSEARVLAPFGDQRAGNTVLGNIKSAIVATYRSARKKHMVRTLAEFEWRFNHRVDLAAMIPALGRAAATSKPAPYWWLKTADYGA